MSSIKKKASSPDITVKKIKPGHWNNGLKASMHDPDLVVESDELVVIIKDKYPKAKYHYLILPKAEINTIRELKREHLSLLKHMHSKAEELITKYGNNLNFRIGYHAVPSMRHLHVHVISQDFDSPCFKTKTHWNSFTTEYFVDSKTIMKQVEETGSVKLMDPVTAKELLAQALRCHVCKAEMKTIPKLKDHIKIHVNKKS